MSSREGVFSLGGGKAVEYSGLVEEGLGPFQELPGDGLHEQRGYVGEQCRTRVEKSHGHIVIRLLSGEPHTCFFPLPRS